MGTTSELLGSKIQIGPAGWSYQDWRGVVYPTPRPRGFHEASYLAHYFPVIEINTSFYRPPRPELSRLWVKRIEGIPRFQFTAKLYHVFTHERILNREDVRVFKDGIAPLLEAGRLGALLMQFPWSFRATKENQQYLQRLRKAFRGLPLVAELRHADWNQVDPLRRLADDEIGFANIDQAQLPHSMPPTAHVTSPIGYVRLHGRNYQEWFTSANGSALAHGLTPVQARYNYLYSSDQLKNWRPRIEAVSQQAATTFVVTNNHFRGQAVVNALQLMSMTSGRRVNVPPKLLQAYPELAPITDNMPRQRSLFVLPYTEAPRYRLAS